MNSLFSEAAQEIVLRPYQTDAVQGLRDGIRQGCRRQILVAPTGAGKTEMAMNIISESQKKGARAWFIVDRISLIDQTSQRFAQYGIDHGIIQADNIYTDTTKPVQVASVQTLARRHIDHLPDLIVWDECFPAGAKISTPSGEKQIENIAEGDVVLNAVGVGVVRHTFARPANRQMAIVRFEDGTEIRCTADHRFFTTDAWVEARGLDGKSVIGIEAMPGLWNADAAIHQPDETRQLADRKRGAVEQSDLLLRELCQEVEEPDAQRKKPREDVADFARYRASAACAWRQWSRVNIPAGKNAETSRGGMGSGVRREDGPSAECGRPEPLQDRSCEPNPYDSNRTGRRQPLQPESAGAGFAQGRISGFKRVVGVQVEERTSDELVFNLHVSGHPSYFADGCLVHNCHAVYKAIVELVERASRAKVIGLSATPFTAGMAEHWEGLVNSTTVNKLLDQGFLSPLRIKACVAPDMAGAKIRKGEYAEEESAERGITIIGDVVQTWVEQTRKHFGGPAKTIVFSPSVKHGAELCRQFAEAGFNFQQISYLDKDDGDRREKIAEFRKPDSAIDGLVSCQVLTKGFDVPDVLVGISCRPYRKSFSSHIQEMGRVMRIAPGKEYGLWLDHSGNAIRFHDDTAWLFEYGVDSLSDAAKRDSVVREPLEKIRRERFCGECGTQMQTGSSVCPSCGWERPQRGEIQIVQGELIDFEISTKEAFQSRAGLRAECLKDPRRIWNACLAYTLSNCRRGDAAARKWAFGIWCGVYPGAKLPRGLFDAPCDPGNVQPEEWSLVEREIRRFRKHTRRAA